MFCSNCGNNLPDDSKFCDSCGTKLEQDIAPVYPPKPDLNQSVNETDIANNQNVEPNSSNVVDKNPNMETNPVRPANVGASTTNYTNNINPNHSVTQNARPNMDGGYQPASFISTKTPDRVETTADISVGNYLGMMFLSFIPIVGIIILMVWAFGRDRKSVV